MELKFIRDFQRAGIEAAMYKGAYNRWQKCVDDAEIGGFAVKGISKAQIASDLSISRMMVYRAMNHSGSSRASTPIESNAPLAEWTEPGLPSARHAQCSLLTFQ